MLTLAVNSRRTSPRPPSSEEIENRLPAAAAMSKERLRDHAGQLVDAVAADMDVPQSPHEQEGHHPDRVVGFEPAGSLRGEWDGDRLAQVVSNLVSNAIQHGSEDTPITVTARDEGEHVLLIIHNEGPPIPETASRPTGWTRTRAAASGWVSSSSRRSCRHTAARFARRLPRNTGPHSPFGLPLAAQ